MLKLLTPALLASMLSSQIDGEYHDGEEVFLDVEASGDPNSFLVIAARDNEPDVKFRVAVETA